MTGVALGTPSAKVEMSQYLSQAFSQQMRMEQRLTPQLIQSMTVLQKTVADLETYINEALESNAALEVAEPEPQEPVPGADGDGQTARDTDPPDAGSFNRLHRLSRDYDLDGDSRAPHLKRRFADSGEPDAKMGALANTAGRQQSLQEHLLSQWSLVDVDDSVRRVGEVLVDHLDPDGLLRVRLDEIAESVRPPIPIGEVESALLLVQALEPTGVGARDLVECLLLQLDALPGDNQVERTLISSHLDDLVHNRLPAIARATGYSIGEINEDTSTHNFLCVPLLARFEPGAILLERPALHVPFPGPEVETMRFLGVASGEALLSLHGHGDSRHQEYANSKKSGGTNGHRGELLSRVRPA